MATTVPDAFKDLLQKKAFAHLGTVMAYGSPQSTPVGFYVEGDLIRVKLGLWSGRGPEHAAEPEGGPVDHRSRKRVPLPGYPGSVVEVTEQGADAHIDALARKYIGKDYPFRQPGEVRVTYKIRPEHVGSDGLARTTSPRGGSLTLPVPSLGEDSTRVPGRDEASGREAQGPSQSLRIRGPGGSEPPEAPRQTVPIRKRTAREVQEKVVPRRTRIRATGRSSSGAPRVPGGGAMRYYLGVDWADREHAVWGVDEAGQKVTARTVPHTADGLSEWGRELDEWRGQGHRALGGDRAARGPGGGLPAGPWGGCVSDQPQGAGSGARAVPAERGQE